MTRDHEPLVHSCRRLPVLWLMLGLLAACASDQRFGGRAIPVELRVRCQAQHAGSLPTHDCADPLAATAFIVDFDDWMAGGFDDALQRLEALQRSGSGDVGHAREDVLARLAPYRRDDGPTPIEVDLQPYRYVFVAELDGVFRYREFTADKPHEHIAVSFH